MNNSLYIAATGMQAHQLGLDTIASNLTNLSTPSYKAGKVNFQELMYADPVGARAGAVNGSAPAAGTPYGTGVSIGSVVKDFSTGVMTITGAQRDVAIQGGGFIEVSLPDGRHAYTRGGTLGVSKDNMLTGPQGYEIKPAIHVPANMSSITIAANGDVSVTNGSSPTAIKVGQIELANFSNVEALSPLGNGTYLPTDASGRASYHKPGDAGVGQLLQGQLEGSNVNMGNQMVDLMIAQRAYELSAKVVQASDEMMSLTNNLRR
jgi:flagellar basal-body rod protein FlgG